MAMIMGDPLQGSRPCPTLADKHGRHASHFKTHSYRCPNLIMQVVEPAYRAMLGLDTLRLSGVIDRQSWCVQTVYDVEALNLLTRGYGDEVLIMGFTKEAVSEISTGRTVDATVGLEVAVAVLIFEHKPCALSHQYDIRRLVPALTRSRHGVIVMWKPQACESIPWRELKRNDGTHAVFMAMRSKFMVQANPHTVIDWFLKPDLLRSFASKVADDGQDRAVGYDFVEDDLKNMAFRMDSVPQSLTDENSNDEALQMALLNPVGNSQEETSADDVAGQADMASSSWSPEEDHRFCKAAEVLARFVAEEISYMVIESRGLQHFASPNNKLLQRSVFQDLQHNEAGYDQGNHAYGFIYDLWVKCMGSSYGHIAVPVGASKKKSSPAGNILEAYKMIAEQVIGFNPANYDETAEMCIEAAKLHLLTVGCQSSDGDVAVHIRFEAVHGTTGCVVWLYDHCRAVDTAKELLAAFKAVLSPENDEE